MKYAKRVILIILAFGTIFGISGCSDLESSILSELEDQGYKAAKVDNDSFFVTQDGVDYYFDTLFNNIVFKELITTVNVKEEIKNLINNEGEITITKLGENKTSILLKTGKTDQNNKGEEFVTNEHITIEFNGGFTEENITNNRGFHDVSSDYYYVTNYFLSAYELEDLYNRALELEDELNNNL